MQIVFYILETYPKGGIRKLSLDRRAFWFYLSYSSLAGCCHAVVVFLPGMYSIRKVCNSIERNAQAYDVDRECFACVAVFASRSNTPPLFEQPNPMFVLLGTAKSLWIVPLHSSLSTSNQRKVFQKCPGSFVTRVIRCENRALQRFEFTARC